MAVLRNELIVMLNQALEMEHAARIQYLTHAEMIRGVDAEPVMERLKEIAADEARHEGTFRDLIGNYLDGEPSMGIAATHKARETGKILATNFDGEKEAIGFYKIIYKKVIDNKDRLPDIFEALEHEIRHVIIEEQQHAAELAVLLGK